MARCSGRDSHYAYREFDFDNLALSASAVRKIAGRWDSAAKCPFCARTRPQDDGVFD